MLLDSMTYQDHLANLSNLEIHIGDILEISCQDPHDMLVISAFPNDYTATSRSVIGQLLSRYQISVYQLSLDKAYDFRNLWNCWLSNPVQYQMQDQVFAKRIVCFENSFNDPKNQLEMKSKIANLYRAISDFILFHKSQNEKIDSITLPIIASGDQQGNWKEILEALIEQAALRLADGFPIKKIRLVLWDQSKRINHLICESGRILERLLYTQVKPSSKYEYDLFISYSHQNHQIVLPFLNQLKDANPNLKIYIDYEKLSVGMFWKKELLNAIRNSRFFLSFVSNRYLSSNECFDELHAAMCRHLKHTDYIFPILIDDINQLKQHPILNLQMLSMTQALSTEAFRKILHFPIPNKDQSPEPHPLEAKT